MKNLMLLLSVLLGVPAFAGPIGSGGPNQQFVDVSKSITLADRPDSRVACEEGSSREAKHLLTLAKREAKSRCQSRKIVWFSAGYSIGDRQDGVPSFDC